MYYWAIKWKKYGEGDLYVSDKQKEYIESEWIKEPDDRTSQQFKIKGEYYSFSAIESIQRSTKRVETDLKQLYAGDAPKVSRSPLTAMEDDLEVVVTQWVKKYVSQRDYETNYAKNSSYKTLEKDDGGVWMAVRVAVYNDSHIPDECEPCTEAESDRLWKSLRDY